MTTNKNGATCDARIVPRLIGSEYDLQLTIPQCWFGMPTDFFERKKLPLPSLQELESAFLEAWDDWLKDAPLLVGRILAEREARAREKPHEESVRIEKAKFLEMLGIEIKKP